MRIAFKTRYPELPVIIRYIIHAQSLLKQKISLFKRLFLRAVTPYINAEKLKKPSFVKRSNRVKLTFSVLRNPFEDL